MSLRENLFGLTEYDFKDKFFGSDTLLSKGIGYVVLLGFGAFFSVFTTIIVFLDYKFGGTVVNSEQFNTAGRSIKTGLTASVIVSQWTWAATLLQVRRSKKRSASVRAFAHVGLVLDQIFPLVTLYSQ